MTTGISLVRENTESMKPPRALWVSFPLGRPLGKPGDVGFQREVILAALDLLSRPEGPVLEDFSQDLPELEPDLLMACPVAFPKGHEESSSWVTRLTSELGLLQPWYELSLHRREGRTLVGVADQSPVKNMVALGELLDAGSLPRDVKWLKTAVEDLKAYYSEAMTAQPGDHDHEAQQTQFWQESVLGEAIIAFYDQYQQADDDGLKLIARILAPREAVGAATGPTEENDD